MPFFPKLIGEVEIRERRQRYAGEPRYKRLSFVKPKRSTDTDTWDVIRPAIPRYIQAAPIYYNVPQNPQYPQPPPYQYQQQQLPYPQHQQQQYYPQHQLQHHPFQGHQGPPSYEHHNLEYREPRRIEQGPRRNEQFQLNGGHDDHDGEDEIIDVPIRPRRVSTSHRGRSQSRSRSRRRLRANSVYSSDDSSDDDYRGMRRHYAGPYRRGIRYESDSDDDLVRYRRSRSRSRSRPRPLRGW